MKRLVGLFVLLLVSLGIFTFYQKVTLQDTKLHVVFCDVGQGDAIIIKTPNNKYILFDTGPDDSVTHCLARHIPYWIRSLDVVILSHPHADHYFGLYYLLQRYKINYFLTEQVTSKNRSYKEIMSLLQKQETEIRNVFAGDTLELDRLVLHIVSPSYDYLQAKSPKGVMDERSENVSVMTHIAYEKFDILLTGDSPYEAILDHTFFLPETIEVMQSPHHGSKTGVNTKLVEMLEPQLAVISVAAKNSYGHPHASVLDLYTSYQVPIARTDIRGDVEIVSDGEYWEVK